MREESHEDISSDNEMSMEDFIEEDLSEPEDLIPKKKRQPKKVKGGIEHVI